MLVRTSSFLFAVALLVGASAARADVPPPDVAKCSGKQVGEACDGGSCEASTCTRSTPEGGTEDYACVRCLPEEAGTGGDVESGTCAGGPGGDLAFGIGLALLAVVAIRRGAMRTSRV